ncbi:MAG: 50S ribosomal protein L9 [Candidatus Pacebacteria bacterium]|nr:50S ribosomal protein L9 [Candidatus Paceibacterota bacterium]
MKVILTKSVPKVGKKGDIVSVSDGYAANALFPNKLAIPATVKNLESLNRKNKSEADSKALQHELLEKAINTLPDTTLEIKAKANEQGHLFSKIDETNIVESLLEHRISISTKNIILESPIKNIGTYEVLIKEGEYQKSISISVIKE